MKHLTILFVFFILLGSPAFGTIILVEPSKDVCERMAGFYKARTVGGKMWMCRGWLGFDNIPEWTIAGEGPRTDPVALLVISPMGKSKGKPAWLGLKDLGAYLLKIPEKKIEQVWPKKGREACIRNGNREVRIKINYAGELLTFARGKLPMDVFDKCLSVEN